MILGLFWMSELSNWQAGVEDCSGERSQVSVVSTELVHNITTAKEMRDENLTYFIIAQIFQMMWTFFSVWAINDTNLGLDVL